MVHGEPEYMEFVRLTRDTDAVRIPAGDRVQLPATTEVLITQQLGGSFTVQSRSHGGLFRIAGHDADSLGLEVPQVHTADEADGNIEDLVDVALRSCYDPEIPVNIVDLGLVYDTRFVGTDDGGTDVAIKMTLTAQGCGMGGAIAADAEDKIRQIPGVRSAVVEIVWDPPWNPRMISDEGRKKLGLG
jgi:probable FeS assembly SUF system protein SufT